MLCALFCSNNNKYSMTIKKIFLILLSVIYGVMFVACEIESKDGDWEPMKWETQLSNINKDKIEVPNKGEVYIFECKNYTNFWIYELYYDGEFFPISYEEKQITREWFSINLEKENTIIVSILPNSSEGNRTLKIGIQAGNAFDSFLFEQK